MASSADRFASVFSQVSNESEQEYLPVKRKAEAQEEGKREYLRVYETLPAQMLNAYGMAAFFRMDPQKVWEELNKPLKTGAKYGSELCSAEEERRGVGINRFLQVLVEYLKYQLTEPARQRNQFILKEEHYTQLYAEIGLIHEAAVYCLAAKKQYNRKGASGLRNAVSFEQTSSKNLADLKDHAKVLYDWIKLPKSRLRMLMSFQSAGGLAYVCHSHFFAVECFFLCGNVYHSGLGDKGVTLEVFQNAIVRRHSMESEGHAYVNLEHNVDDFK